MCKAKVSTQETTSLRGANYVCIYCKYKQPAFWLLTYFSHERAYTKKHRASNVARAVRHNQNVRYTRYAGNTNIHLPRNIYLYNI